MNTAAIAAFFQNNKPAVLGTAAAGVAGLALLQRRKAGGDAGPGAPSAGLPAAAVIPASGSIGGQYDSTALDLMNALSPQLEQIMQQTGRSGIDQVPGKVASSLFSPTFSGNYVRALNNGGVAGSRMFEVQSDGSLLHLTQKQWDDAIKKAGFAPNSKQAADLFTDLDAGWRGSWFDTSGNIGAISGGNASAPKTLDAGGRVIPAKTG